MRDLFAVLPGSRFCLLAGRDVYDDAQKKRSFRSLNQVAPDLNGELGSIFTPGEQLQAGSRGRRRCGMKTRRIRQGLAPEPLRHQHFDILPDELLALVTK